MYEALESRLSSLRFYSRDYMLAIAGKTFRVENESDQAESEALASGLKEIGALKSLIAYFREAIKAKEQMDSDSAFDEHIHELIKAGRKDLEKPSAKKEVSFEDEFAKLTAEQVDAVFFALQKEHRNLQAEFNRIKSEVDEKVADANKSIAKDALASFKLWVDAQKVERTLYDAEVKALKVVIPQNLRDIYTRVNTVADAK